MPRPVLIDESDGPCEICAVWAAVKYIHEPETGKTLGYRCDECGCTIPKMGMMHGRGFQGVVPHHFHLRPIGPAGIPGRVGIHTELCPECYRKHRQDVYPNETPERLERMLQV